MYLPPKAIKKDKVLFLVECMKKSNVQMGVAFG
jgi:hypothetical protein